MADSDRSRSPVPMRNRLDSRGQPLNHLPFFPRWCGPMSAAVRHYQNMPRPQTRPVWSTTQSGPQMMGRMWTPPVPPTSWASQQFPPTPPTNSLPPTLPYPPQHPLPSYYTLSTHTTVSTDTALLAKHTIHFSITATVNWHSKIGSWIKATQQRSLQNLRLRPQSTLARGPGSLRQPED